MIGHVYLTSDDVSGVFARVHHPPEDSAGRGAILVCAPFGWEDVASYRVRRDWAEHLTARGHVVVRFDPPGTGDSAGSPLDHAQLDAWTSATTAAAAWLLETSGGARVTALGLGLGGMVAWRAAASGAPIDDLVLWGVPAQGRRIIRELRAFSALDQDAGDAGVARTAGGPLEIAGHVIAAETQADLDALDLTRLPLPAAHKRRILVLDRENVPADRRLISAATAAGAAVREAPGPGWAAMTEAPQTALAPDAVIATVDDWLEGAPAGRAITAPSPHGVATSDSVAIGPDITEAPLDLDHDGVRLTGILAHAEAPASPPLLCAVFLNAGAIRRIGPNRLWVEAARRAAAKGIPSLRLDIEGLGDADGDAQAYGDVAQFYVPHLAGQVTAALDELERRGLPPRFLIVGLCSGAFMGFHAALADARVRRVVMLNAQILYWNPAIETVREGQRAWRFVFKSRRLRSVVRPSLIRDEMPVLARVGLDWLRGLPRRLAARRTSRPDLNQLTEALDRLAMSRTRVAMAFSGGEPLPEELASHPLFADPRRWPTITVEPLPGRVHELRSLAAQARAHEIIARELAGQPEDPQ